MCNKREKREIDVPFNNVKYELMTYWKQQYQEAKKKWNRDLNTQETQSGEGYCFAKLILINEKEITGVFDSRIKSMNDLEMQVPDSSRSSIYHAEMQVLNTWFEHYKEIPISALNIYSPPCPKCAVVLECLNLSGCVHTNNHVSKESQSANWPLKEAKRLVTFITKNKKIKGLDEKYFEKHAEEVYKVFMHESWHK